MYVCGVTVYDYSHIGHARVYVAFDVLFRQLMRLGYDVTYVRNFTDVDDKIIARANETAKPATRARGPLRGGFSGRRHEFELFAAFARAASHGAHGRHHRHDEPFGGEGARVRDWGRGRVLRGGLLTLVRRALRTQARR